MGKRRRRSSSSSSSEDETETLRRRLKRLKRRYEEVKDGRDNAPSERQLEGEASNSRSSGSVASPPSFLHVDDGNMSVDNSQCPEDPLSLEEVVPLDENVLKLLGNEKCTTELLGDNLHQDLAIRWENILRNGMDDDVKGSIIKKYPPPKNCILMAAPKLNLEVKAAVTEAARLRDERLAQVQSQVGASLCALGRAINILLEKKEGEEQHLKLIECVSDSARLLADVHHQESKTRRNIINLQLKKDVTKSLSDVVVDGWLFGANLGERVKAAKAIEQYGKDLKMIEKPGKQKSIPYKNSVNSRPSRYRVVANHLDGQKYPTRRRSDKKYFNYKQLPRNNQGRTRKVSR